MAKIKERLLDYLKISKITKQEFCEKTGISYANMVGNSLKSELGGEQITSILMNFPILNPDWLLLGKGEMLRQGGGKSEENTPCYTDFLEMIREKDRQIAEKDRQMSQLLTAICNLTNR
ncbi:MAG: hypothetical protein IKQ94_04385 [Bacteroidales bacterium]|nr:hypothetical protein [Bacteroidales bacterium]